MEMPLLLKQFIMKTLEERKAILENEVTKQLRRGWRIGSRTETGCQIVQDKKRSTFLVIFLFLLFIIPGIFYLLLTQGRTISALIEVNDEGKIIYSSRDLTPSQLEGANIQANSGNKKVTIQPQVNNQATADLGLLSIANIADGLKIPEEDVIKLIDTNELKGKKIGDKYFVRKEDFDAFMKK